MTVRKTTSVLTVTRYGKEQVITSLESLQNGKEVGA